MGSKIADNAGINVLVSEINKYPTNFTKFFNQERLNHYEYLAETNPQKYKKYLGGWKARLENFFSWKTALVGGSILAIALYAMSSSNKGR